MFRSTVYFCSSVKHTGSFRLCKHGVVRHSKTRVPADCCLETNPPHKTSASHPFSSLLSFLFNLSTSIHLQSPSTIHHLLKHSNPTSTTPTYITNSTPSSRCLTSGMSTSPRRFGRFTNLYSRKDVSDQISDKITPDSTKSTTEKVGDNLTGFGDKAASAIQPGK